MKKFFLMLVMITTLSSCGKEEEEVVIQEPKEEYKVVEEVKVEFDNESWGNKPKTSELAVEYGELLDRRDKIIGDIEAAEKEREAPRLLDTVEIVEEIIPYVPETEEMESEVVDVVNLPKPVNKNSNLGYNKMGTKSIDISGNTIDTEGLEYLGEFRTTAYDLSYNSVEYGLDYKYYGITKSGKNLSGMTRAEAMTVAVDPKVIELGTKLYLEFPYPYSHFTGTYSAEDIGGAIKGKDLDLFMGDFKKEETDQSVWDFGVRMVRVYKVG